MKDETRCSWRPPSAMRRDTTGQLATEWILVTAVVVLPIILFIPTMLEMLNSYFNRVAGFVALPFP